MDEKIDSEFPTLQDRKLNRLSQKAIFQPISAESNPFRSDKLAYINPHIQFTNTLYDFSRGLPKQLPFMIALGDKRKHPDALLYCRPDNRRTGVVTSSSGIIMDGIPLNYLDEKGMGQLNEDWATSSPIRYQSIRVYPMFAGLLNGKPTTWGGADLEYTVHDAQSCDALASDGIRIIPTVAIVKIDKIPNQNGEYLSIDEAKKQGLVAQNSTPAIQFRAYVTPFRPKEFIFTENSRLPEKELQRRRLMMLEALTDMSVDKSIPIDPLNLVESLPTYLIWFAQTFGQAIARLHNAKKVHNWLHELHNITLDVRIVDSDGLETNVTERDIYQERGTLFTDFAKSRCELWKFYESIKSLFELHTDSDELLSKTITAYNNERNPQKENTMSPKNPLTIKGRLQQLVQKLTR